MNLPTFFVPFTWLQMNAKKKRVSPQPFLNHIKTVHFASSVSMGGLEAISPGYKRGARHGTGRLRRVLVVGVAYFHPSSHSRESAGLHLLDSVLNASERFTMLTAPQWPGDICASISWPMAHAGARGLRRGPI